MSFWHQYTSHALAWYITFPPHNPKNTSNALLALSKCISEYIIYMEYVLERIMNLFLEAKHNDSPYLVGVLRSRVPIVRLSNRPSFRLLWQLTRRAPIAPRVTCWLFSPFDFEETLSALRRKPLTGRELRSVTLKMFFSVNDVDLIRSNISINELDRSRLLN